jgi:hypothetical protein
MEQTEYSETLALKLQTPVNNPDESIQQEQIRVRCVEMIDICSEIYIKHINIFFRQIWNVLTLKKHRHV